MERIIALGTGAAVPTKIRGMSCIYIDLISTRFLIDCGEGSQLKMIEKGLSFMKLDYIFISHRHGDHWYGILGLLDTMELYDRTSPLHIFVPIEDYYYFEDILPQYEWMNLTPYDDKFEIELNKDFKLKAFKLKHSVPTYGFYLEQKDKIKFDKEKMNSLPIEERIKIVQNYEKYPDFWTIKKGNRTAICPDTRPIWNEYIQRANIIIHECTFSSEDYDHAIETWHTSAIELKPYSKNKKLYLYHISPRYKNKEKILEDESGGTVLNDFDEIIIH